MPQGNPTLIHFRTWNQRISRKCNRSIKSLKTTVLITVNNWKRADSALHLAPKVQYSSKTVTCPGNFLSKRKSCPAQRWVLVDWQLLLPLGLHPTRRPSKWMGRRSVDASHRWKQLPHSQNASTVIMLRPWTIGTERFCIQVKLRQGVPILQSVANLTSQIQMRKCSNMAKKLNWVSLTHMSQLVGVWGKGTI